jgi:uncharacterized membrane protein YeaQ/YmgE (transglycosylase-associated protein family)
MKTQVVMKNSIIEALANLGLVWNFALNGFIGGTIWSIYKKSKFWESIRQMIVGAFVAGYLTPVIKAKTGMSDQLMGCTSFVVGMLGMVIVDSLYKHVTKLIKKYKEAVIIINKNEN